MDVMPGLSAQGEQSPTVPVQVLTQVKLGKIIDLWLFFIKLHAFSTPHSKGAIVTVDKNK